MLKVDDSGLSIVQSNIPKMFVRKEKKQSEQWRQPKGVPFTYYDLYESCKNIFFLLMIIFPSNLHLDPNEKHIHRDGPIHSMVSTVLLIFDGDYSNTKSIELIDLCYSNVRIKFNRWIQLIWFNYNLIRLKKFLYFLEEMIDL